MNSPVELAERVSEPTGSAFKPAKRVPESSTGASRSARESGGRASEPTRKGWGDGEKNEKNGIFMACGIIENCVSPNKIVL